MSRLIHRSFVRHNKIISVNIFWTTYRSTRTIICERPLTIFASLVCKISNRVKCFHRALGTKDQKRRRPGSVLDLKPNRDEWPRRHRSKVCTRSDASALRPRRRRTRGNFVYTQFTRVRNFSLDASPTIVNEYRSRPMGTFALIQI